MEVVPDRVLLKPVSGALFIAPFETARLPEFIRGSLNQKVQALNQKTNEDLLLKLRTASLLWAVYPNLNVSDMLNPTPQALQTSVLRPQAARPENGPGQQPP